MIVLHYGGFTSRFCQHGFRSLLPPRRALRARSRREPPPEPAPRSPRHAPEPTPRAPKRSDPKARNLLRMGVFTGIGVGGAYAALTELQALELRERLLPPMSDEKFGLLDRVRRAMPNLTSSGVYYGIVGTCVVIFLGWQVPALRPIMNRYFMNSPISKAPVISLVLSTYSHKNALHLGVNMLCFTSFFEPLRRRFSPKQLVFFLWSAGLVSGFGGALVNTIVRGGLNSVGFSGVLLAGFALICLQSPDTRFSIFFLGSFRGEHILPGVVLFDLCGLLFFRKASFLDHAAHLCGAGFGMFYEKLGQRLFTQRVLNRAQGKSS